jgi:hypothetical protein
MPDGKILVGEEAVATDCSGGSCSAAGPVATAFGRRRKNRRIPSGRERASWFRQIVIAALVGFEGGPKCEDPVSGFPSLRPKAGSF